MTQAASGALIKRLLGGGVSAIAASAFTAFVPITGAFYLDPNQYAVWALAATMSTIFIVFDFGSASLSMKLAAESRLNQRALRSLLAITAIPPMLLALAAILVWPMYSAVSGIHLTLGESVALFGLVGFGTALRSAGVVFASSAQGRGEFGQRATILLSAATVQLVSTVALLSIRPEPIVFGVGVVLGGLVQLSVGILLQKPDSVKGTDSVDLRATVLLFVRMKGLATLLGLVVTQLDRWALGLVAPVELLGTYDLATRLIMMPKVAILALLSGLVAEAGRADRRGAQLSVLVRRVKYITFVFSGILLIYSGVIVMSWIIARGAGPPEIVVLCVVVGAHTVNCATAGPSLLLTGIGKPGAELAYLAPLAALALVAYSWGYLNSDGYLQILAWGAAMIICSGAFTIGGFVRLGGGRAYS